MFIGKLLLSKWIQVFSKPSELKYDWFCQVDIYYSNRRYTQKNNTCSWKNTDTVKRNLIFGKNPEYYSRIDFRKSHQTSWCLDDLLKSYKTKYTKGWPFNPHPHPPTRPTILIHFCKKLLLAMACRQRKYSP